MTMTLVVAVLVIIQVTKRQEDDENYLSRTSGESTNTGMPVFTGNKGISLSPVSVVDKLKRNR